LPFRQLLPVPGELYQQSLDIQEVVWRASILLAKSSILLFLSSIPFAVVGRYHISILYWRCRSINTTASERIATGRGCALVVLPVEKRL
jgi:hypothetical protein